MYPGKITIAIDGPSGAGKSTVSRLLAQKLGLVHIDTGAMYRALTLKALRSGIELSNENALTEMAMETEIILLPPRPGRDQVILLDGQDVSEEIRSQEVNQHVSLVAQVPGVRAHLLYIQRKLAEETSVIMDGRDIGTVVLPSADFKFFLTAGLETRAKRRCVELYGECADQSHKEQVLLNLASRDTQDASREYAPLRQAEDAILIDTTNLDIAQVVDTIINYLKR